MTLTQECAESLSSLVLKQAHTHLKSLPQSEWTVLAAFVLEDKETAEGMYGKFLHFSRQMQGCGGRTAPQS